MERLTTTPFGQRPVTASLISRISSADARPDIPHTDKWEVFRQICTARLALGVTDRDLTVLNALLSFYPEVKLSHNASLIVFPSNKTLGERAHGMAESTLRRHLASLVDAGLVQRHDSPNGKRYARRNRDGDISRAFGFDLSPLLKRAPEIAQAAQAAEDAAERIRHLREEISLAKRDALKLAIYGQEQVLPGNWDGILSRLMDVHKVMRRKLDATQLDVILEATCVLLDEVIALIHVKTEEMDANDSQNERHFQNSDTYYSDSEPTLEQEETKSETGSPKSLENEERGRAAPILPLNLVLKACPDIEPYALEPLTNWHSLTTIATSLKGMMGISPTAWDDAKRTMGTETATIVVCCILQRFTSIRNPGGYLRSLSAKAAVGAFSPAPMVMALLNGNGS